MIREIKTIKETTIKYKYCDVCGTQIKSEMACSVARCQMCGKDLCEKCIGKEINTMCDYREVYCKSCWDIGEEYRNKINQLENEIDKLNDEWLEKCKSKK